MSFSGYPAMGFSWWCTYIVRAFSSLEFFPRSEMGDPHFVTLCFLLYYPAFAVLRPRVGLTFPGLTFVPSV